VQSGQIANFSSIGGMVLSRAQQEKIGQWQQFWDDAKKARLQTSLITSGQTFGFKDTSFDSFYQTLAGFPTGVNSRVRQSKRLFIDEFAADRKGFYTISSLVKSRPKSEMLLWRASTKRQTFR
jgi:hypothetical protein